MSFVIEPLKMDDLQIGKMAKLHNGEELVIKSLEGELSTIKQSRGDLIRENFYSLIEMHNPFLTIPIKIHAEVLYENYPNYEAYQKLLNDAGLWKQ